MLTCLCDAFYGEVGIATVRVLEHAGCEVSFNPRQTCCGQPPFNSGDWDTARKIAGHFKEVFSSNPAPIVCPSGSCTAMLRDGYSMLFPTECVPNGFELSEFLVNELGLKSWPFKKPYNKKVAYHKACHGRGLHLTNEAELLLGSIDGLELMPIENAEQCCGFGGAFCVTQGKLSSGIGLEKLRTLKESGAEEVVSGDMGCLMHLQGLSDKQGLGLKFRHFAEVLADTVPA
ncbi:MAG TPA: (Fe-S)-binding protein [Fimbriimonadaceae bacterium]|jgi:L-lactate dehydrogenase complex protein LldE